MKENFIQNSIEISQTPERKLAISMMNGAFRAIDTEIALRKNISIEGSSLMIAGKEIPFESFDRVRFIAFGKASSKASAIIEDILGDLLHDGYGIGVEEYKSEKITTYKGDHPEPTLRNVKACTNIIHATEGSTERDLFIVVVSGGGSALLCYPESEFEQGKKLYHEFLGTGGTIEEMNIVRKHISLIKGGGLAKHLYPAHIEGLILSDVPGDAYEMVASGPTYKDVKTVHDAMDILNKYNLDTYNLIETPKEDRYFKNVRNTPIVANTLALESMKKIAEDTGYSTSIISTKAYFHPEDLILKMQEVATPTSVILVGGESRIQVPEGSTGKGGRNMHTNLVALDHISDNQLFISFASDGMDNSNYCGGIADHITLAHAEEKNLNLRAHLEAFNSIPFFIKTNDVITTGKTEANVSDLMMLITK